MIESKSMFLFKFFLGFIFFKPAGFLILFVSDYGNEYKTKRNKNQTDLKKF